jgi:hypothetical protein
LVPTVWTKVAPKFLLKKMEKGGTSFSDDGGHVKKYTASRPRRP